MQRRAAAVAVAFFLVISAGSYALIATAETPEISFEDPAYSLQQGESFTEGGQEYTVTKIEAKTESGGGGAHGGGGGGGEVVRSGEIAWTNRSARHTATWANGSSVTRDGRPFTVLVEPGEDPSAVTLREQLNRTAILRDDPDAENELATFEGQQYVVVREGGQRRLVAPEEYFPEPETRRYAEGDSLPYRNHSATVEEVTADGATLAWTAPRENTVSLSHRSNVTLGGSTYLAFFPDNSTVYLVEDFRSYNRQVARIDRHHTHVNGLWGVNVVSGLVAAVLLGMAYLPSRY